MKRKSSIIILATLVMVLCVATAAYALTLSGWSSITPGTFTMKGTSQSSADATCSEIQVTTQLYRSGSLVGSASNTAANSNFVEAISSGPNTPGTTLFENYGSHYAYYGGQDYYEFSYASLYY